MTTPLSFRQHQKHRETGLKTEFFSSLLDGARGCRVDPENRMYLLDLWRGQTSSDIG